MRMSIAQRVLKELNGVRRLKPADAEQEIEYLRALAMSLTAAAAASAAGRHHQRLHHPVKTLLNGEFIESLLGRDRSSREEVQMLIRLAENVMGAGQRAHRRPLAVGQRPGPALRARTAPGPGLGRRQAARPGRPATGPGRAWASAVEDYGPCAPGWARWAAAIEADAPGHHAGPRAAAAGPEDVVLIKLAMGDGRLRRLVADEAKAEVMKLARALETREELAASPETMDLLGGWVQQKAAAERFRPLPRGRGRPVAKRREGEGVATSRNQAPMKPAWISDRAHGGNRIPLKVFNRSGSNGQR